MPMKLNVGLSRKIGEQNYGSRGASVNVEMELESSLATQPDKLKERIRQLFGLIRSSLDEELNGSHPPANNGQENGEAAHRSRPTRPATKSQVKALYAITKSQGLDLSDVVRERFGATRAEDLALPEASQLIDALKGNGA